MKSGSLFLAWTPAAAADPSPRAAAQAAVVAAPQNLSVWSGAGLATWGDLAEAARKSGTYTLVPGTSGTFNMDGYSGGDGIELANGKNVTVLGQGAVLDASKKGQFFNIAQGASLTLKNLTLQHGFSVSGCCCCMPPSHSEGGAARAARDACCGGACGAGARGQPHCWWLVLAGDVCGIRTGWGAVWEGVGVCVCDRDDDVDDDE
jgi:hypothetical protein